MYLPDDSTNPGDAYLAVGAAAVILAQTAVAYQEANNREAASILMSLASDAMDLQRKILDSLPAVPPLTPAGELFPREPPPPGPYHRDGGRR